MIKILDKPQAASLIRHIVDRPGHDRRYAIDSLKLHTLGWSEKFGFDEAFTKTINWYKSNESWLRSIQEKKEDFKSYYAKNYEQRI
jgi:dTDP-glucose 4,6-dehydratase